MCAVRYSKPTRRCVSDHDIPPYVYETITLIKPQVKEKTFEKRGINEVLVYLTFEIQLIQQADHIESKFTVKTVTISPMCVCLIGV